MTRFWLCWMAIMPFFCVTAFAQGVTRQTYHDAERKHLKEVYLVKDNVNNILHGRYISYYLNGKIESKGQFENNETTGVWEFFYETGNLKMRGILLKNANFGLWEYFYENGQKSMEGIINGRNREGEWKTYYENSQLKEIGEYRQSKRVGLWKMYYEDGKIKAEINYTDDVGHITEYHHSGKIMALGERTGTRNTGHWQYFGEDEKLQSEGEYVNGKKQGEWRYYHSNGKLASKGTFDDDESTGVWEYYFEDGKLNSTGEYLGGKKSGYWKTLNADGSVKSEVNFDKGSGEYREYYADGKLKVKGQLINEKHQGKWQYFYADGTLEGECDYIDGKGLYKGYYPNGALQTKGSMEEDKKTGTWEIYEADGKLSGYYRPFYDNRKLGKEITSLAGKSSINKVISRGKRFTYFDPRFSEFRGVIIGTNPVFLFAGELPLAAEFYLQERLGHEFEFIGVRDPFFKSDPDIPPGKQFIRGYSIAIKQKFYNPLKAGMWYFGHEIRFTNLGHFTNIAIVQLPDNVVTASSVEQRIEYGILFGYRVLQRNNGSGLSVDAFISGDIGYRGFDVDTNYGSFFSNLNQSRLSTSFHFGLNFGQVFSFSK